MSEIISPRRAWTALAAMAPAVLVVGLDVTVLSVALPTLARDLSASTDQLQWFVMAYTITFAAAIIPSGLLADRLGRRRILLGSLVIFGLGSSSCVLSSTSAELIASRALLGIGASGIATLSVTMITVLFPEERRGKAMTALMLVNMLGFPLGPIVGGWLLSHVAWEWIFAINLPIVVIALIAAALAIPESRGGGGQRLDLPGLASLSAALVLLCYGLTEAGAESWTTPRAWSSTLLGVLLLIGFVRIESRTDTPMVPLGLFRLPRFAVGAVGASLMSFVVAGLLFLVPQYCQAVLGASTQGSGFYLISFAAGMLVVAPLSGRIVRALGRGLTVALGFGLCAIALALATRTTPGTSGSWLVAWSTLVGIGFGLALPTSMDLALGEIDGEAGGVGSAVLQALRQVATTIGAAVLGGVLGSAYRSQLTDRLPDQLPAALRTTARKGVEQGIAVADRLDSPQLLYHVRSAFVIGMDDVALICAGIGVVSCIAFAIASAGSRAAAQHPAPAR